MKDNVTRTNFYQENEEFNESPDKGKIFILI